MNTAVLRIAFFSLAILSHGYTLFAQDDRGQYPLLLRNSYIDFNLGYINYPFTDSQLSLGSRAESIDVKHLGMRIIFFGGRAEVADGIWVRYQRNVFHTRKLFSLDMGSSFGYWKSDKNVLIVHQLKYRRLFCRSDSFLSIL
ncbi:hypothetical protein L0152_32625 [bacterium]|nr:hypothetical protein [bacterium]